MVLTAVLIKVNHLYQYKNIDVNYDINRSSNINLDMKLRIIFLIIRMIVLNNNNGNSLSYYDKLINENTSDSYN